MRVVHHFRTLSLPLALAFMLPLAALADGGSSCLQQLDACERLFFGKTTANASVTARLETLEQNLYGSVQTGSMPERLKAIRITLSGSAGQPKAETQHIEERPVPKQIKVNAVPEDSDGADRIKDLLKRAVVAHSQGDLSEASRLFDQVLVAQPGNTDANYNLGTLAEERGDLNAALQFYRRASASAPEDSDIRSAVTSVERKLQKHQSAIADGSESDDLTELAKQAGAAFKNGKYDEAINKLQTLSEKQPSDPTVQFGLSRAWYRKGDLGRCRQYLIKAIALAPDQKLYTSALAALDKEIRSKQKDATVIGRSDGAEVSAAAVNATANADKVQTNVPAGDADGVVPFTDKGAPRPLVGAVAADRSLPAPTNALGYETPMIPANYAVSPLAAYAVNPFDQAILAAVTGMSAVTSAAHAYPVYGVAPTPVRYSRVRLGRAGSLATGLLGLLGVGY